MPQDQRPGWFSEDSIVRGSTRKTGALNRDKIVTCSDKSSLIPCYSFRLVGLAVQLWAGCEIAFPPGSKVESPVAGMNLRKVGVGL
jgi:hypothetical protein